MEIKRFDLIVLGATGFTGQHVVKYLFAITKKAEYTNISWAISGRSKTKLLELLEKGGYPEIPMIECDIKLESSIVNLTKMAKVLMNVTGPNTELSAPVVKACIESKIHYVDISAERFHVLNIYKDFHSLAEAANVLVVPACGFATIPATAGLIHLEKNFKGNLRSVDCYAEFTIPKRVYFPGTGSLVNHGTWDSMLLEFKNFNNYRELKRKTFPELVSKNTEDQRTREVDQRERREKSFFHTHIHKWWCSYPGPEHDVMKLSQQYLEKVERKNPYYFQMFTTMPYKFLFFIMVPLFFLCYYLSHCRCFRWLMQKHPRIFTMGYISKKGPTESIRNDTKFNFTLTGNGVNKGDDQVLNNSLTVQVRGDDPGYKTTALSVILSAITILQDSSLMPKGGVLMTHTAFYKTNLVQRIKENGLYVDVI